ncbi:ribosome small subunit-dependent GTPase A [bacterium]|nr:ribosome small subunit-dependent GTPase A [bacterium]
MKGKVVRVTGKWTRLRYNNSDYIDCLLSGQLRLENYRTTSPLAAGDEVEFEIRDGQGWIVDRAERRNYIIRRSVNLSKEAHVIAANLDQSVLVVSLAPPRTLYGFIDRFLATSEAYSIPSALVVNKMDLYDESRDADEWAYLKAVYEGIGYPVLPVSAVTGAGMDALRALLRDKVSLMSGNSGVGKSSMINALDPELHLRTGALSSAHSKGQHTTTFAELFELRDAQGVWAEIIDTPGVKSFGLVDMEAAQMGHYFPEIFTLSAECRFHNCVHREEPGCAVLNALENNGLAPTRYESYVRMMDGVEDESPYRHDERG